MWVVRRADGWDRWGVGTLPASRAKLSREWWAQVSLGRLLLSLEINQLEVKVVFFFFNDNVSSCLLGRLQDYSAGRNDRLPCVPAVQQMSRSL